MKNFLQRFLPKKNRFLGIDVGASQVKVAEVKVVEEMPVVVSLRCYPSPPGIWTEQFDEESLVEALKKVTSSELKEVITCIGGEKVVSRIVCFPQMSAKELETAVRFEVEKFVPIPVDQLIIRHILLGEAANGEEGTHNVLLLAVPAATVYQYYSIFSRAGLIAVAVDLQAFALWRLFGKTVQDTTFAIVDIGARTSHFVVIKDTLIRFLRLLPLGGDTLTNCLAEAYGLEFSRAQQMKEEASISPEGGSGSLGVVQLEDVLRDGLLKITTELHRSLEFYSTQENLSVAKLILSGGTAKLKGLAGYLEDAIGIPVEVGVPEIALPEGEVFDPAYAVAIGLALREAVF